MAHKLGSARVRAKAADTADRGLLHGLAPLVGPGTRVVILGSFPGVASLAAQQYYGHRANAFWRILMEIMPVPAGLETLSSYEKRSEWLLMQGLGLWDVYASCRRAGSLDSAIADARLNDLSLLRQRCPQLQALGHNGGESWRHRGVSGALGLPVFRLPSTSPANAGQTYAAKRDAWRAALAPYLALN